MTNVWLPLVKSNFSRGILSLAQCDSADSMQSFSINLANSTVTHVASGLCVTQVGAGVQLALAPCTGIATQTWITSSDTLNNGLAGNNCLNWNNVNNVLPSGNPIIAYACDPAQWNAKWMIPKAGTAGLVQAQAQLGGPSGMCASIESSKEDWSLPWFDEWSLKDF